MQAVKAIIKREWGGYFNSPVAYVFIIIFLGLMGVLTFLLNSFYEVGRAELRSFFSWYPWLYLILVPAVAMRLWSEERRSHTIEILLTLPVTIFEAILGKFLAAWLFIIFSVALTFPMVLTVVYLGDPDQGVIFAGYLGSILLAGAYLSVGMFTSALTKNQVVSFILSVVLGFSIILVGIPPVTYFLSVFLPGWLVDFLTALSFYSHYETLQRGIIDFRDLVFFASVIGVMLYATQITLNYKASA